MTERTCTQCGQTKPLEEFHRMATGRDGRRSECAECSRARARRNYRLRVTGPLTLACEFCGIEFTYVKTSGRRRMYCSATCKHAAQEAAKKQRAGAQVRTCACGSIDVARVGKPVCPACRKDPRSSESAQARERRRTLRKYGITEQTWDHLLARQDGRCAICRTDTPGRRGESWHIDHDHVTGLVRGLLCQRCNLAIGMLEDSPDLLSAALRYIESHRQAELFRPTVAAAGGAS
ncbi:MAG: endonuclease VII domain-containing protein [Streptosporangiaceae bacterium]